MTVAAPPRPVEPTGTGVEDTVEALIEEAKQRARRRRRLYGFAASVAVIALVAAIVGFNGTGSSSVPRAAVDAAAGSPVGELGVFEPIRGWIVFPDGAGGIAAVDPDNPTSRRTVLANPGDSAFIRPARWSTDGTQLALHGMGGRDPQLASGSWIMDSTGSLTHVGPYSQGDPAAVFDDPWTPDALEAPPASDGTALWRLSDGATYLIPYLVAKWMTVESDPTRKWEISFLVWHTALSNDGQQLLLTAAPGPGETERNWGFKDLATAPGLYVLGVVGDSLDGSSLRRIAAGTYHAATWSPDGTQIAAIRSSADGPEIVVMNADGTDMHTLIELDDADFDRGWGSGIAWHPLAPND